MKSLFVTFSAIFITQSALATSPLGFEAELQCSIAEKPRHAILAELSLKEASKEQADLLGAVNQEVTTKDGRVYAVNVYSRAAALTMNTSAVTFHQFISVEAKDGSFKTYARSGPHMFRMESFSDIAGGYFANSARALCNLYSCPEISGEFGVPGGEVISVHCQVRGLAK
jgi:hypothetical protein